MAQILVLGTGLAGYTLAREIRRLDPAAQLLIVTRDEGAFYSKPMLSNALATGRSPEQLETAGADRMSEQLQAEIMRCTAVLAIDPMAKRIQTASGSIPFQTLVLALGADPVRVQLEGDAESHVLSVNDLADYAVFREALVRAKHVAIIGAGLIGCEFANDLAATGYEVTVLDPGSRPLARLLPPQAGAAMARALAAIGINWRLGCTARAIYREGPGVRLELTDGGVLYADVVLSAVGLRPRIQLAADAGLRVNRGIVVDRYLQASENGIYALGDCAEVEGLVLPFVMPIMHGARALAKTLSGDPTPVQYPAMPVLVKTPAWPTVVSPPPPGQTGEWDVTHSDDGVRALFRTDAGELVGFALCGSAVGEKNALLRALPAWLS